VTSPSEFDATLENGAKAAATDFSSDSRVLLVAFGGFGGGVGMPPFEFFRITSEFGVNKIFIRDLAQAMYHRALPGIGGGVDGIVRFVQSEAAKHKIERTVVVGNSGGAYASLLFGALLEADVAHAFSPVTFIGPLARLRHRDRRAPELFWRAVFSRNAKPPYYDLKSVLRGHGANTEFHIYYCPNGPCGRLDKLHAERMSEFENVTLHLLPEGGHELVKLLRDSGELKGILRDALAQP
jgi:pimeloyl-ACP methyl ester carboxylesterase